MGITRANPYLEEIIDILDLHRRRYQSDDEARSRLSKADNDWIDGEWLHCMTEPRYFLSNYYAIRTEDKGFQGLYPFFDSQEIIHDELRRLEKKYGKVKALIEKARRMGYTTYMIGEILHKTIFWDHTDAIIVSQDEKGAKYNMGMYESAFDFLPWWIKPRVNLHESGSHYNFDEPDEELRSQRPGLKNWVYADNANRPSGVGRGQGFRRAMLDELAFWKNASQLSKSLLRTFNAGDGFYVMGSTANGRNDAWHNLWRRAEAGSIDWNPIFIPFYRRSVTYSIPIESGTTFTLTPDEEEFKKAVLAKDNFEITDATMNWMRKTKEEFIATDGDDRLFSQEFPATAEASFQTSAVTAFPRAIITKLSQRVMKVNPIRIGEISYDFNAGRPKLYMEKVEPWTHVAYPELEKRFHIFEEPKQESEYVMGVDVALGNPGSDYSVVQVIKKSKHAFEKDIQVAVWHGLINPGALAEIVLAIGWFYNEAMAAVEVNSYGLQTNSDLMRKYEYDNIYRYKHLDKIHHFVTNITGFLSTAKSTDALMARMSEALLEDTIEINCRFTMDEFNDYTEEGAIGDGAHDDYVDALLIALYCAHEAEVKDRQQGVPKHKGSNKFIVVDRNGVIQKETTSQLDAEKTAKKIIGSSIRRMSGSTAKLQIGKRVAEIPADFANTEFSPVFDKDGTAKRLYEEGAAPEDITPELIAEWDQQEEEIEQNFDAWMYE